MTSRTIHPTDPDQWIAAAIDGFDRQADGTYAGTLTMATVAYHIRGYRKEGSAIRFEFQPVRVKEEEEAFLRYLDGLGERVRA